MAIEKRIPKGARSLDELLDQHEQWKVEAQNYFVAIRAATGMTQSKFAEAVGTSQSYINDIEHGRKTPSSETLAKLRSVTEGVRHGTDKDQE